MAGAVEGSAAPATASSPAPAAAAAPAVEPAADVVAPDISGDAPALVAARKAEQQLRRQVAQARAELDADYETKLQGWRPRMDKAEQLEKRIAAAKDDPIAFLRDVGGFTDADFGPMSRLLYGSSPEGIKDPRYKAAAEKLAAEQKSMTRVEQLEKKLSDIETRDKTVAEQRAVQAQLDTYADGIAKEIGDKTPLAKHGIATDAAGARARMLAIADEIYVSSGPSADLREVPRPADVLAEYERRRGVELEALRPEFEALAARKAAATLATAPVLNSPASPNGSPARLSRDQLLAGIATIRPPGT